MTFRINHPLIPLLPLLLAAAAILGLQGCALVPAPADEGTPPRSATRPGDAAPARSLATMATWQYITIDAERTGVANVADDGRYTYIAFQAAAPAELDLFDADGEPLENAVRQGRIVAVAAVQKGGILVRLRGDGSQPPGHSFIAPNPRAQASDQPDLDADPDLVDARSRLENLTVQGPEFRRAIERAESRQRDGRRAATSGTGWPLATGLPIAVPGRNAAAPAISASDADLQRTPRGNLVRVFFASGGRAIVRPDDGLARIEEEALQADEIQITGFTDSQGSEPSNTDLARARAEAIQALLVKRGVPPRRIVVAWHGVGRYLADNTTEEGRAMNRRVEVLFIRSKRGGQDRERYSAR